nr:MAG TPA: hypothetical protein [Caudoviricetes sp.]
MSNEKFNTVAEEEVLENVEFTEHAENTDAGNEPQVEQVKENKLVQFKNKALGFIGKHKFALGVATGVASVIAADRVMNKFEERKHVVDAEFEVIDEPTVDVEEIDYPQEEVEDAVEE